MILSYVAEISSAGSILKIHEPVIQDLNQCGGM